MGVAGLAALVVAAVTGPAKGAVNLGTAESFAVLANTTITNTGTTTITGDVGLYPGTSVTGFGSVVQTGALHVANGVAQQALIDAGTAYGVLQGRTPCTDLTGQVLGQTVGTVNDPLLPGVYCFSSSAQLTGDLYLTGGGEYIFQIGSTLTTASGSRVILQSGAEACNVFWAVGSSATLGTSSQFVGTIIANTSITATTGAVVEGRLFALNGAVTLQFNTITRPICATTTTTSSTTTTAPPATTSTTVGPGTTSTTVAPGTTTTTLAPGTTTTTAGPGGTTTTTLAPGTTTTLAPGATTTTTSTTTTSVPATTTSTSSTTTTTVLDASTGDQTGATTTTVAQAGTTTSSTTTTRPTTTTTTTDSGATGTTTATTVAGGRTTTPDGARTGALARTGSSLRWLQFWAGMALALGGVMVRLTQEPFRRRESDGA